MARSNVCRVCGQRTVQDHVCEGCLNNTLDDLAWIRDLAIHLKDQALHGSVAPAREYVRASKDPGIPGGEALTLLLPGGLRDILQQIADGWCGLENVRARPDFKNLGDVLRFMTAAAHIGLSYGDVEDSVRIRYVRHQLERVLSVDEKPVRAAAGCFDCSGELVRRFTDTGLSDNWECRRCGRAYSQPEYWLAVKAMLEEKQDVQ